jgi:hypothetical protein
MKQGREGATYSELMNASTTSTTTALWDSPASASVPASLDPDWLSEPDGKIGNFERWSREASARVPVAW